MKKITIFCSAQDLGNEFVDPTKELAKLMVENNYDLVWGGSDTGLMSVVSQGVKKLGGKIFGVSVEFLKHKAAENADEMFVAKDLQERKQLLVDGGDAILILVGGIGTLDEVMTVLEMKKHDLFKKPIVILNTNNFYTGLQTQLVKMRENGFVTKELSELVHFANTPSEVISHLSTTLK
jgi:hypothetical protein